MRTGHKKDPVTVSIDAGLLELVDSFVEESANASISRSSVFEDGLHLWQQSLRNRFDAQYYATHKRQLEDKAWSRVTRQAI